MDSRCRWRLWGMSRLLESRRSATEGYPPSGILADSKWIPEEWDVGGWGLILDCAMPWLVLGVLLPKDFGDALHVCERISVVWNLDWCLSALLRLRTDHPYIYTYSAITVLDADLVCPLIQDFTQSTHQVLIDALGSILHSYLEKEGVTEFSERLSERVP
jgi:hypothetical protein